jgi:hypothetical protein
VAWFYTATLAWFCSAVDKHPISPYIADFYCSAARLVVEIDGAGHGEDAQILHDQARDRYMEGRGYRVLRISAADVMANADEVAEGVVHTALELIREAAGARLCAPSVTAQKNAPRHVPRKRAGEEWAWGCTPSHLPKLPRFS